MEYTAPTFTDWLYADVLYDGDFPILEDIDNIAEFWEKHAVHVWRELLKENFISSPILKEAA